MIKVNKPKIRFKNFNDSWSLRKLSDTQTDFKMVIMEKLTLKKQT